MKTRHLVGGLASFVALGTSSCGTSFDSPSLVESVRLLAIQADKPYAAPGDTVNMTMLAYDGRPVAQQAAPMRLFWVPVVCPNPPGDSYFACYPGFAELAKPGVDLDAMLTESPTFSFHVPEDIITSHPRPTSGTPFGLVTVFAIACAGHVQLVDTGGETVPPAPPLGCFDDAGAELGPNDSVFAYAQVFSFADGRTNQNPVIDGITIGGATIDATMSGTVGGSLTPCPASGDCPTTTLATNVPASSWEPDPADLNASGQAVHEEIWVDYYVTAGSVPTSALIYDAEAGAIAKSSVQLTPPTLPLASTNETLWAIVRDNRGGVSWVTVPLAVQGP